MSHQFNSEEMSDSVEHAAIPALLNGQFAAAAIAAAVLRPKGSRMKDVEMAQMIITKIIQDLHQKNEIIIAGRGGEELIA